MGFTGIRYYEESVKGQQSVNVPLKDVEIVGKITDVFAKLHVTQNYYNDSSKKISNCTYFFELDDTLGSAISENFQVFFSKTGRRIVGEVKKKEVAKREYSVAKSEGKKTSLFVDNGNGSYEIEIGNIDPEEFVTITFAYNSVLQITSEGYKFAFPTTIAPRYNLGLSDPKTTFSWLPKFKTSTSVSGSADYKFKFDIEWTTGTKILDLVDNMTKFVVEKTDNKCRINMTKLPEDGNLSLTLKTDFAPAFYVSPESDGTTCVLTSLQIPDETTKNYKKEYIFLFDRSGSMDGSNIESSKNGLMQFLDEMKLDSNHEASYFNIIGFGSTYSAMFPESQQATSINLDTAKKILTYWKADLGGTELLAPIQYIQRSKVPRGIVERLIILLTDGEVSDTDAVINYVGSLKNTRTFTIGIGSAVNRNLITKCAEAGNGVSACVIDVRNLPQKIKDMLDVCAKLYYTDVTTQYYDSEDNLLDQLMSVQKTNVLYPNKYFMNISLFKTDDFSKIKKIKIVGVKQDGSYEKNTWTVDIINSSEAKVIDQLFQIFVKEAINLDLYSKEDKIDMCIKHTVLCDLVSMIAVDHESTSVPEKGVDVVVPNYKIQYHDSLLLLDDVYGDCDGDGDCEGDDGDDGVRESYNPRVLADCSRKAYAFAGPAVFTCAAPASFSFTSASGGAGPASGGVRPASGCAGPASGGVAQLKREESCSESEEDVGGSGGGLFGGSYETITESDKEMRQLVPPDFDVGSVSIGYISSNPLNEFITSVHGIIRKKEALQKIGKSSEITTLLQSELEFYKTIVDYLKNINPDVQLLNILYCYLRTKVTILGGDDEW